MEIKDVVRKNISELRQAHEWSQTELARRVKMKASYISKIESGDRKVSSEELDRFANVFGVSSDYILGRKKQNTESLASSLTDIDEILDQGMTFEGKPLSKRDRDVLRGVITGYLKNK